MMGEMELGPTGTHTCSREPEKWKENAQSADLLQADDLESDPFFELVGYELLASMVTFKKEAQSHCRGE